MQTEDLVPDQKDFMTFVRQFLNKEAEDVDYYDESDKNYSF